MQTPSIFAEFPGDVTRSILETAAEAGNWSCALVSKEVKAFSESLLYRRIELIQSNKSKLGLLHRTVLDHPSKEINFFALHVKMIVYFCADLVPDQALAILEACKGIKQMVYAPDNDGHPHPTFPETSHSFLSAVTQCAPTHIYISGKGLPRDQRTFSSAIFRNVTHLSIVFMREWGWDWDLSSLALLKSLTHLSIRDINGQIHQEHMHRIVQHILSFVGPAFRVLVVHTLGLEGPMGPVACAAMYDLDPRIAIASTKKVSEWFEGTFMKELKPCFCYSVDDHIGDWLGVPPTLDGSPKRGFWEEAEDTLLSTLRVDEAPARPMEDRSDEELIAVVEDMITNLEGRSSLEGIFQVQGASTAEGDQSQFPPMTKSQLIVALLKGRIGLPHRGGIIRLGPTDGQEDENL